MLNKEKFDDYKLYKERILQFGEGNFLRAFADFLIDDMNKNHNYDSSVIVIQPRNKDHVYELNKQDGLYTVILRGLEKGEAKESCRIVNSISRGMNIYKEYDEYLKIAENPDIKIVLSNTTEAGITFNKYDKLEDRPPESYPGKLLVFLYHRYLKFKGSKESGLYVLPCELIEDNGDKLKEILLKLSHKWNLEDGFIDWINEDNYFCNTLVDRIVPGTPEDKEKLEEELGYKDNFMVEGENYFLWVIEGKGELDKYFPAEKLGYNVVVVDDISPYRTRKVSILNGAHTSMVPVAYLYGLDTVKESVENGLVGKFIEDTIFYEIIPTINMDPESLKEFAEDVLERFKNPFIRHELISISLNSMSKFKTRVLPTIKEYSRLEKKLPKNLLFSFAALIVFYRGKRGSEEIKLSDDEYILNMYEDIWSKYDDRKICLEELVREVLSLEELWNEDLNEIEGLNSGIANNINIIMEYGMEEALERHYKEEL